MLLLPLLVLLSTCDGEQHSLSYWGSVDNMSWWRWKLLLKQEYLTVVQGCLEPADSREERNPPEPSVAAGYGAHEGICWHW